MGIDRHRRASSTVTGPMPDAPRLDSQLLSAQLELKNRALASSAEGITIADARLPGNPLIYVNAGFERLTVCGSAGESTRTSAMRCAT